MLTIGLSSLFRSDKFIGFFPVLFILFTGRHVAAQAPAPGGVAAPRVWLLTGETLEGRVSWRGLPAGLAAAPATPKRLLNFHPVPELEGRGDGFRLKLPGTDLAQFTILTVHQPADTLTEKIVWSVGPSGGAPLVLTTHRFADLAAVRYRNFPGMRKDRPGIRTYYQHKPMNTGAGVSDQVLLIGAPPLSPDLPVQPYRGVLPEIIVYDRVLSPAERTKVESYLALKYGLTLAGGTNYLNAAGEVIWDAAANRRFSQRIAGVGRDDAGALFQKQSASSYQPEMPTISIGEIAGQNAKNLSAIPDRTFLIWGDDGGALNVQAKNFAQPRRIGRTWLMTSTGQAAQLSTTVRFDLGRLAVERLPEESYWLLIDRSGTGRFPAGAVEYYPAAEISGRDVAVFRDIQWDRDASGADCFTIGIAGGFTGVAWLEEPACQPPASGHMSVGAIGGRPPYRFLLQGPHRQWRWQSGFSDLKTVEELEPGVYQLTIQDEAGALFVDSLFLSNADGPVSGLADWHMLMPGQPLALTAAGSFSGDDIDYYWHGPEGFTATGANITVLQPGLYQLTMNDAGCISQQTILVEGAAAGLFRDVAVFPNPAKAGRPFNLALTLEESSKVTVTIRDMSGRNIRQHRLGPADYHSLQETLNSAGAYLISVQAGTTVQTLPLVVE